MEDLDNLFENSSVEATSVSDGLRVDHSWGTRRRRSREQLLPYSRKGVGVKV